MCVAAESLIRWSKQPLEACASYPHASHSFSSFSLPFLLLLLLLLPFPMAKFEIKIENSQREGEKRSTSEGGKKAARVFLFSLLLASVAAASARVKGC